MSAKYYQLKLQEVLEQKSAANKSAREWKTVAENRLELIKWVDGIIHDQIKDLLKIGTIFGVDPTDPGIPLASSSATSGDEAVGFIYAKISAVSIFTSNLTREASSLQSILSDTLVIATQAEAISPPTEDLALPSHLGEIAQVASPLQEVFNEIENSELTELDVHEVLSRPSSPPPPEDMALQIRSKEALFAF